MSTLGWGNDCNQFTLSHIILGWPASVEEGDSIIYETLLYFSVIDNFLNETYS